MEKYKMKYISLILLTVFLSSPCFAEEWVIKVTPLGWGANAQGKGLTLPLEGVNELVTASGDYSEKGKLITQVKPVVKLHQGEQEWRRLIIKATEEWGNSEIAYHPGFAETSFGAKDYLPEKEMIKSGPNGGGGGAYQAQLFLWEPGSISEEQIQQIAKAMEGKVEIVPLYSVEGFNPSDAVQYDKKRVLSESMIKSIKESIENPTLEYQLQEHLTAAETLAGVAGDFSDYSSLANVEDTEKGIAYIGGLGNSPFGLDTWSAYGKADAIKKYGISGFSSEIEDYSSMKGLMLIGPNGGGGAGAYMIGLE